jgi:hypothetical protein
MRLRALSAAALVMLSLAAWASPAQAATAQEAINLLNAQRTANGIPGGIVERPDWSTGCAHHNRYEAANGGFSHSEDPAKPGYTADGNFAAQNSVLAFGAKSFSVANPWQNMPVHLAQLLAPAFSQTGYDEYNGFACMTTFPGYNRPPPSGSAVYTYPGAGATNVTPSQTAKESPNTPGDFVGLPQGTTTGPHLFVFGNWSGSPIGQVTSASLTGPSGAIEVRFVDNTTNTIGTLLPRPSGILIPVLALAPHTTYQASVVLKVGAANVPASWSFTTGDPPSTVGGGGGSSGGKPTLKLGKLKLKGSKLSIPVDLQQGQGKVRVKLTRKQKPHRVLGAKLDKTKGTIQFFKVTLTPGTWTVQVTFTGKRNWSNATLPARKVTFSAKKK